MKTYDKNVAKYEVMADLLRQIVENAEGCNEWADRWQGELLKDYPNISDSENDWRYREAEKQRAKAQAWLSIYNQLVKATL